MISYQPTQQAGRIFLFSDKIFLSAGKINIEDRPVLTPNIVTDKSWRNEIKKYYSHNVLYIIYISYHMIMIQTKRNKKNE